MTRLRHLRRGSALIEFALVSLVLYLLLAATLDLGRATFSSQALQDVARVCARELALTPLPAETSFADALADPTVRAQVFSAEFLVIDLEQVADLDAFFAAVPVVNQALRPLMVVDRVELLGAPRRLLRYPGALITDPVLTEPSNLGLSVAIPQVTGRDADGVETLVWLPVLEEIRPGAFPLSGGGVVALRLNYPFQAAALSGHRTPTDAGGTPLPLEPNGALVIEARDADVSAAGLPTGQTLADLPAAGGVGPYAGRYGLGRQLARGGEVRPYRSLLRAQAVFQREALE